MDTSEFTDLIRRHAGLIHKIAYAYCRGATDREDVVQEIAVQLWRSRDRYDERYRHTTWIYRIALNVAISFYRRERRHREHGLPIEEGALVVVERPGLGPRARRLIDALSGRSLRAVAGHLTELSRFERDEPAA
jgi:RNA polymerase sigma-70 factor (ECF subfamily)